MRISAQVPFLHRVDPRYLKLVTPSNFWLFTLIIICIDVVHADGHDLILFFTDFHFKCRCFVYESIGEVLKFISAAAIRSMSSANSRFHTGFPPMEMDVW